MTQKTKPESREARNAEIARYLKVLIGIAGFWLFLFVIVLFEHARSWAKLLPVIGVVFIAYAVYATRSILKLKQKRY
jgi:hypothetical protein